ncbi:glutamine--fructose-6-phosphate transaminase (isomerizing) [Pimelobacter simplex]|uniref:Glutamine--fructose-6-phosphate aminotransferase [isomerizing] n=1 Tax=Nocardioides simplex TaxID=2045 RepID=A0A0A1DPS1_NOCSI|nr:glutamine--fructose-6-phosphate transaminase (isomerizing) [Pimelobacter simplex]AIY19416.1 Glucosamine--fructose-6-phosphate aminotransferase [isomerizing] [Pimelobacter simplex]MCG8149570.1 glutamine--fructose-6-phosphate transaminase (isomerizing) [Pimelobacter simplex]GEB16065.1 glutamine--fructose-6-phosphate aminotransferase [isomerizing] [Pimelobacter simplex]SFM81497.1 glucosamine--fructose-6-phosphate aminotransferase (isomerizing) [Pimelobacter simplex]
MCGIVGYIGAQQAAPVLVEGLTRLEHRGYDSAGLAVLGGSGLRLAKRAGRVRDLAESLPHRFGGKIGIGHTRWATHGPANDVNAHPHTDAAGRVAVVHNGIIDNAAALRAELADAGVPLVSDTDTEVLAHLVARSTAATLEQRTAEALARVEGTYGVAVAHADFPDRLVVARNGSPLIIGVGEKEMHVASDLAALVRYTTTVAHLDDGEMATVTASGFTTYRIDPSGLSATDRRAKEVDIDPAAYDAGEHDSFMHKEMLEQPARAEAVLRGRLDERFGTGHLGGLNLDARELRAIRRVKILGCGSAYYVGEMGASLIEELARVPADAEPASEFRYRNPIIEPDTLYVAVSQSGETIDTLLAVQEVRRKGGRVIGLVNVVGSAIAREVDGGIYLHAGPEVAVASTKALTNMYLAFAMLAIQLGRVRDLSIADGRRLIAGLTALPGQIEQVLATEPQLALVAHRLAEAESLFFVGRVRGFPVAREGAQKFKEISYRHAEAYQTSELKHGPLALISPQVPTVAIVPDDELVERNVAALEQIAARGGPLVVVTHEGVDLGDAAAKADRIDVPRSERELDPILLTIPLQVLAYHAALSLGHDIDKPRNLAKSVTVE